MIRPLEFDEEWEYSMAATLLYLSIWNKSIEKGVTKISWSPLTVILRIHIAGRQYAKGQKLASDMPARRSTHAPALRLVQCRCRRATERHWLKPVSARFIGRGSVARRLVILLVYSGDAQRRIAELKNSTR